MVVVVKLGNVFVHKNKRVRALSAVGIATSGAASNNQVSPTGVAAACFLRVQCAAGYLKRYAPGCFSVRK